MNRDKDPHSGQGHDHDHSGHGHSHGHEPGRPGHDHRGHGHEHNRPGHDDHDHSGPGHGLFHSHAHGDHHHGQNASERRLWWSLTVLAVFTALEAIGGFWSHSIALLAEAAHMLADCGSLILAVLAIRVSRRPARPDRTYGHRRYQPLAAYTNGLLLLAITVGVVVEAARRLVSVPHVLRTSWHS
jgi:cobalt-zinc-cadmium efflux system protein